MWKQKLPYKLKSLKINLEDEVKMVGSELWYHDSYGEGGGDGDGNG